MLLLLRFKVFFTFITRFLKGNMFLSLDAIIILLYTAVARLAAMVR